MLTNRQNLVETIKGGKPERYVNQFDYMAMIPDPIFVGALGDIAPGVEEAETGWGVKLTWPEGEPGLFPLTDESHKVVKDVTRWRETVKIPRIHYSDEEWAPYLEMAAAVDRKDQFVTVSVIPGIFEKLHFLMGMEDALVNFYEEPEAMHELIDHLTEWELETAEEICRHMHPDALYHHDDWGSQKSSFMSPEMFREFLLPSYQKIYAFWKAHGVELIVHHSDSYLMNLVPCMVEMGVDIWQGTMSTNDIPALIKEYGGKLTFQGGIDNGKVDRADWTPEKVEDEVEKICRWAGNRYFIPNLIAGDIESTYPGVYQAVSASIEKMSREMF